MSIRKKVYTTGRLRHQRPAYIPGFKVPSYQKPRSRSSHAFQGSNRSVNGWGGLEKFWKNPKVQKFAKKAWKWLIHEGGAEKIGKHTERYLERKHPEQHEKYMAVKEKVDELRKKAEEHGVTTSGLIQAGEEGGTPAIQQLLTQGGKHYLHEKVQGYLY